MMASRSFTDKRKRGRKRHRTEQKLDAEDDSGSAARVVSHNTKKQPTGHRVNNNNNNNNNNSHVDKKAKLNTTKAVIKSEEATKPPKKQLPLAGKLVAVTALQSQQHTNSVNTIDDMDDNDNTTTTITTYAQLVATCRDQAGADTTSQVHKRVYCLVATNAAIQSGRRGTQRVRKAWKLNIPVVRVIWLQDCIEQGRIIDFATGNNKNIYVASPPPQKSSSSNSTTTAHATTTPTCEKEDIVRSAKAEPKDDDDDDDDDAAAAAADAAGWSEAVDLGCCCVCHDSASPPTDCPWCVECSVNLAAAAGCGVSVVV
jgi:hypothetical protein